MKTRVYAFPFLNSKLPLTKGYSLICHLCLGYVDVEK